MGLEDLGRIDFIYISHIHEDHCSPKSVNALNRDAEVIIISSDGIQSPHLLQYAQLE